MYEASAHPKKPLSDRALGNFHRFLATNPSLSPPISRALVEVRGDKLAMDSMPRKLAQDTILRNIRKDGIPWREFEKGGAFDEETDGPGAAVANVTATFLAAVKAYMLPEQFRALCDHFSKSQDDDDTNVEEGEDDKDTDEVSADDLETRGGNMPTRGGRIGPRGSDRRRRAHDSALRAESDREAFLRRFPDAARVRVLR